MRDRTSTRFRREPRASGWVYVSRNDKSDRGGMTEFVDWRVWVSSFPETGRNVLALGNAKPQAARELGAQRPEVVARQAHDQNHHENRIDHPNTETRCPGQGAQAPLCFFLVMFGLMA